MTPQEIELFRSWQRSPKAFVKSMWGLTPQRDNDLFVKGLNISWQQDDILTAIENALAGKASKRISVKSGHGIGKSTTLAWIALWYLTCFKDSQIPCTAPTTSQMHDVLWKELAIWLKKMPKEIQDKFEWTTEYLRVTEAPESWFARAKTARKEAPEALAGVHGEFVMFLVDEASGVPEEIFNTAEGALTSENIFFIMISNPTRLTGYFYNSHHKDKASWQTMEFDCNDSPIVDQAYVDRIIALHGKDSDEYRIRVQGKFPKEDAVDDKGYVPLLSESDLHKTSDEKFVGDITMGVDPAGEGSDETVWVIRDAFKARVAAVEKVSTGKTIAQKTMTLMTMYNIHQSNVTFDSFGVGVEAIMELAKARVYVEGINVGVPATDDERFINKRAELYWSIKEWMRTGGELINHTGWDELLSIRYRRELNGKLKIMSKDEMRKEGIRSPNIADALMLSFLNGASVSHAISEKEDVKERFDQYSVI